ncbi:1-acylglycerol-3-phosphate O-acyltransferase [Affinibrenneria salicis]|uniref:1-acyl-sn-glycerol-3-phosphate acyltransferase n=1 Tax=Affinibrenneria salicis TaxID=2590031 RepID=A0A5J5FZG7_9GAMM|nr:1-acylglycerol-3-phosphate O-acyltransferase [Affinibrenneria salicis]KAA8999286.1 1-acylglycerol-3-phosphate O-acyltransferase [Affinibrenneria salicis]
MIFIFRLIVVLLFSILVSVVGSIYCLFSPGNPAHVATFGRLFGRLSWIFGLKVDVRVPKQAQHLGNCIYIANHQNNFDMVTAANVVQPRTVTVGKKSLVWIPFFGPLYWLTGNLLIDRQNRTKAHGTISQVVKHVKEKNISIWMFPEGTRSRGRGLLPFKTGAFHAAIGAGVPIVPICISNTHNKVKLNRWYNGHVIIEMLPPVDVGAYGKDHRGLAEHCYNIMKEKLAQLDAEVAEREAAEKRP